MFSNLDPWDVVIGLMAIAVMIGIIKLFIWAGKFDRRKNDPNSKEFRKHARDTIKIEPETDTSLDGTKIMSEPYKVE